ncbi:DUF3419 family protein [Roseiconus nitratireducens]|uniref:DUF3419 family protein n=1 Tax=Roseiconus nitratireducens TaxID=2605748 RepID=A0A5M6D8T8_9BACT|nr:DUF3419 family protein [Roseiconus nitratireducens]KAA5543763.1 DUF3419 family protein [Roseiconus nitratireducens]
MPDATRCKGEAVLWKPNQKTDGGTWVEDTSKLKLAFAQVREDPLVDQSLLEMVLSHRRRRPSGRVLMIASGGETAALLSKFPLEELHLVDLNPAQLDLCKLKLHLLNVATPAGRLALLGHRPMPVRQRAERLKSCFQSLGLAPDALGPFDLMAEWGPDFCGRYEWLFARLRYLLAEHADELELLMSLGDVDRQTAMVAPETPLGTALDRAMRSVMDLETLVKLFGAEATSNRRQPFAEHFLEQTRAALASGPACENPYLHQIFLGRFRVVRWPWLEQPRTRSICPIRYSCGAMNDVLWGQPDSYFDLIHLSNILDWISPSQAEALLLDAARCLMPGGRIVIRQLNSCLDIPSLPTDIRWDRRLSADLHQLDRSFFYRSLHVGTLA